MLITEQDRSSLIDLLKSSPDEIHNPKFDIDIFNYEFNEFMYELEESIKSFEIIHVPRIIDRFYTSWIENNMFSLKLQSAIEGSINAAVGYVLMHSMAAQMASICSVPLATAYGITLVAFAVKIQVTTPQYVAVGTVSRGIFKYSAATGRKASYSVGARRR